MTPGVFGMILKQNVNLEWRTNRVSPPSGPQKCFTSFSNFLNEYDYHDSGVAEHIIAEIN